MNSDTDAVSQPHRYSLLWQTVCSSKPSRYPGEQFCSPKLHVSCEKPTQINLNQIVFTGSLVALLTGPPDKPVINVERTTNTITVRWKSPDDGGRPITSYKIQIRPEDGNTWQDCPDIEQKGAEMSCSFTDLDSGTKYVVRVIAVNEIGPSEPDVEQVKTEAGTYNAECFMDWTVLGPSGRTQFIILHGGKSALFRRLSRCFRSGAEHVILIGSDSLATWVPVVQRLITLTRISEIVFSISELEDRIYEKTRQGTLIQHKISQCARFGGESVSYSETSCQESLGLTPSLPRVIKFKCLLQPSYCVM